VPHQIPKQIATAPFEGKNVGLKVHVYSICWNERRMIEYFLRHYEAFAERIVVYDDDSNDGTTDILKAHSKVEVRRFVRSHPDSLELSKIAVFNRCWMESRGLADYVFIVDCDEHVHHPALTDYLSEQKQGGVTLVPTLGFQMVSDEFPGRNEHLATTRTQGCPALIYSKPSVFDPNAFDTISFAVGSHRIKPAPISHVSIPARDELMLLHYKFLGVDYVTERYFQLLSRRGSIDRRNGWDVHFTLMPDQFRRQLDGYKTRLVDIAAAGFSAHAAHNVPLWRTSSLSQQADIGPHHAAAHWM
jgi:glycosyltransferase involved in cell wall biosynthesis